MYDIGAITWSGINGTLENSVFIENHANRNVGTVSWNGDSGNIIGSTFTNNTALNLNDLIINSNYVTVKNNLFNGVYAFIDDVVVNGYNFLNIKLSSCNENLNTIIKVGSKQYNVIVPGNSTDNVVFDLLYYLQKVFL